MDYRHKTLYDLIPACFDVPRNPLDKFPYTFHRGDIVWFTLNGKDWKLGFVTKYKPKGVTIPGTDVRYWVAEYIEDHGLRDEVILVPLYGTVKPDGIYIRKLLSEAGILPEDDSKIEERVQGFFEDIRKLHRIKGLPEKMHQMDKEYFEEALGSLIKILEKMHDVDNGDLGEPPK
ncbi:hypothetical protein EW145_g5339 [Phellinidium pouzarii]|uniref:Uncharacterized protein n=1 Tax=Phellinidium pouzarii TaxID=167371 RepID=A0A4S4L539_9AGAM|nr:hypothetical protein EW145_g5339 [Phellinidium pouzarii]